MNLDCGWSTKHRDPRNGSLLVNTTRFPHGMRWLADQIHGLGLKFGVYGALGFSQCCSGSADKTADDGSVPGSLARMRARTRLAAPACAPPRTHTSSALAPNRKHTGSGVSSVPQDRAGRLTPARRPFVFPGSGPGCNHLKTVCRNETFHERDARLWAEWRVDLLKFDGWCVATYMHTLRSLAS